MSAFEKRLCRAQRAFRRAPYADAALFAASAGVCLAFAAGLIR